MLKEVQQYGYTVGVAVLCHVVMQVYIHWHEFCHGGMTERFLLEGPTAKSRLMIIVKIYENENELFGLILRLRLSTRVSSVVKGRVTVRFQIRFYDFVAVSDSDHSAELPSVHESSQ